MAAPHIGIDEAGRGCLAGPVTAAAVLYAPEQDLAALLPGLDDSKKLTPSMRQRLDRSIREQALAFGLGYAWQDEIDQVNILNATLRAMCRAVFQLARSALASLRAMALLTAPSPAAPTITLPRLVIDGTVTIPPPEWRRAPLYRPPDCALALGFGQEEYPEPLPALPRQNAVKRADSLIPSVSAASILAKTARDALMNRLDQQFRGYGFAGHKGYGTAEHLDALKELGPCPLHRLTFAKVRPEQPERTQHSLLF